MAQNIPLDAQWVCYLCKELDFWVCDAQELVKTEIDLISVPPPPITKLNRLEIHLSRASIEEAHGEGLVIYLSN